MLVFRIRELWSAQVCFEIRAAMDRGSSAPAEIFADGFRLADDVRRSFDVEVDAATVEVVQQSIDALRPRISAHFGVELVASEGPGFVRYPTGGYFRVHRDVTPALAADYPRRIALVIFLTTATRDPRADECAGGVLRVYHDRPGAAGVDISPVAGSAVAFPATMLHEVLPVTAGTRDAIVDWFY
jgi:predicted 2-oxoglutarate/Fe(II)-dependent dioxygenase YbiX